MKAILTTTHGAHRISATDGDGNTVRIDRPLELQYEQQHDAAALALCRKMGWHGTLAKGHLMRGGVGPVARVYVWTGGAFGNSDTFAETLIVARTDAERSEHARAVLQSVLGPKWKVETP